MKKYIKLFGSAVVFSYAFGAGINMVINISSSLAQAKTRYILSKEDSTYAPNLTYSKIIDSAISDVSNDIMSRNLSDSIKYALLGKVKTIPFLVSKNNKNLFGAYAFYRDNNTAYRFAYGAKFITNMYKRSNVIILKNNLDSVNEVGHISNIPKHELFHYVDDLLSLPSQKLDYKKFVDTEFYKNDTYAIKKMISLSSIDESCIDTMSLKIKFDVYQDLKKLVYAYREVLPLSEIKKRVELYARFCVLNNNMKNAKYPNFNFYNIRNYNLCYLWGTNNMIDKSLLYSLRLDKADSLYDVIYKR